jgi:hypothetical protein
MLAIAALAATAAGCSWLPLDGRTSLAGAASPGSPLSTSTLAFESIDGPPPEVFSKLVANLNDEAGARQIAVVSRTEPATYRVRGYVSALVERNKTTFAWVWDVYDTDKRRTLRIAGEELAPAGRRRSAWAAADDELLRRMARDGMQRIAGFLNASEPLPAAIYEPSLTTLVSGRDDTPEGAGIFRVFSNPDQPAASPAAEAATDPRPSKAGAPKADAKAGASKSGAPKAAAKPGQTRSAAPQTQAAALAPSPGR